MTTNTMVALRQVPVTSATGTITFDLTGISGYTDLVIISDYNLTDTSSHSVCMTFNNISTGTYSYTPMVGYGSGTWSGRTTGQVYINIGAAYGTEWGGRNNSITNIMNFANTTTFKTVLNRFNNAATETDALVGLFPSLNAITRIDIKTVGSNTFTVGSTFSLYGIANADIGAYATGGVITQDANYYYHAFGNSSYFTPTRNLTADILVVAGGGGGGYNIGGGGGAGGLLAAASQSLSNGTTYTCTIGAGGAGGFNHTHAATGGNSSISGTGFTTIATDGGGGGGSRDVGSPYQYNGNSGGSGGGGANTDQAVSPTGGAGNVGSYSPVEGYAGGIGYQNYNSPYFPAGGGGGAGGAGQNATSATTTGGYGGVGAYSYNSINFSSWLATAGLGQNVSGTYYVAGGGGGGVNTGGNGPGGYGGGATAGSAGVASTGGGGGGGTATNSAGSAGGSGLILIRYAK